MYSVRARSLIFILFILLGIGSSGYMIIEGWSLLDSLYMTLITLTTIGFTEIHPLTEAGRIYTICLIFIGVGSFAYIFTTLFKEFIHLSLTDYIGKKRMLKEIGQMSDHTIICGFGQMGKAIAKELAHKKHSFVVVECDKDLVESMSHIPHIVGSAEDDKILMKAGIERAKSIVLVASSDSINVFIALSASALNSQIQIIARASRDEVITKLKKAGATKVISPYNHASSKIVQTLINPEIHDFLDFITDDKTIDFQIADIEIKEDGTFFNKTVEQCADNSKIVIVGHKKKEGSFILGHQSSDVLKSGDRVVVLGFGDDFSQRISQL